ncbi:MAG: hypothetical protein ACR2PX_20335 [Endozoicomonas sp.]|uniref:hypothetical protein n=1 Tax=Endozoicomonas sp. TaxID=1892382 RepID=UPI003D9BD996
MKDKIALLLYRFFSLVFAFLVSWKVFIMAEDLMAWFDWWSLGAKPKIVQGEVYKIYEYEGDQVIIIKKLGQYHRLDFVLNKKQLYKLKSTQRELEFQYYLTSSGMKYVFQIRDPLNNSFIYQGNFNDSGWQGVVWLVFLVFFLGMVVFFIYSFLMAGKIKRRFF